MATEFFEGKKVKRIVVPSGMVEAAMDATIPQAHTNKERRNVYLAVEASLRWLSENPIIPTDEQVEEMRIKLVPVHPHWGNIVAEWQRRMFLAPELEVLEPIKDLLCGGGDAEAYFRPDIYNDRIVEAYRRGRSDAK